MPGKFTVTLTYAKDNADKATVAFVIANAAIASDKDVVVLRTFSKWAGLAGLRLGYGMMSPDLIRAIRSVQPPYSVGQAAEVAESPHSTTGRIFTRL